MTIVHEVYCAVGSPRAVDRHRCPTPPDTSGITYRDFPGRASEAVDDVVVGPGGWYARFDTKRIAGLPEAEKFLEADPVHPARGARVPRPSAAPEMRRRRVDIRR